MTDIAKTRRFKLGDHAHLTLPSGLTPVDGQPNMRFEPGQTFEVSAERCQTMQRFVLGRIAAGDLVEVTDELADRLAAGQTPIEVAAPAPPSTPTPAPADDAPKGFTFAVKKEG